MRNPETELAEAVEALNKIRERARNQTTGRDRLIIEALAAGMTWTRAQEITGLSRQSIANIVNAAK